jgi:hypothetical protein
MKEKIFLKIVMGLLFTLLLIPANLVAGGGGGGAAGGGGMGGHGGVGAGFATSGDSQDFSDTGPHSSGFGQGYTGHEPMDPQGSQMMGPQAKGGRGAGHGPVSPQIRDNVEMMSDIMGKMSIVMGKNQTDPQHQAQLKNMMKQMNQIMAQMSVPHSSKVQHEHFKQLERIQQDLEAMDNSLSH